MSKAQQVLDEAADRTKSQHQPLIFPNPSPHQTLKEYFKYCPKVKKVNPAEIKFKYFKVHLRAVTVNALEWP
jgi:hypothetical protein